MKLRLDVPIGVVWLTPHRVDYVTLLKLDAQRKILSAVRRISDLVGW